MGGRNSRFDVHIRDIEYKRTTQRQCDKESHSQRMALTRNTKETPRVAFMSALVSMPVSELETTYSSLRRRLRRSLLQTRKFTG
jgi:hypothetical protein